MRRLAYLVAAFVIGCTAAEWADVLAPDPSTSDDELSASPQESPYGYGSGYAAPVAPAPAFGASQPRMTSALEHLRNAKRELDQADTNKGGYRKEALRRVEDAIEAVENGMRYDAAH